MEEKALDSEKNALFLEACTLCNDAAIDGNRLGDPTELALLDLAREHGFEKKKLEAKLPRIDERAFDSDRKRMTTVHRREPIRKKLPISKGQPTR